VRPAVNIEQYSELLRHDLGEYASSA